MAAALMLAAIAPIQSPVSAIPLTTPRATASPSATPSPPGNALPIGSTIALVLDATLSSASSKKDDVVPAHLKDALVLDGTMIAAAGAPVRIRVIDAKAASNPDIYGYIDIYVFPLLLASGGELPVRPPTSHLNVNISAGHASTSEVENTVGDIFTPTMLLHVFRKGRNFTLEPGAIVNVRTQATVSVSRTGTVSVTTPAPMLLEAQTPHSSFNAMPLSTPSNPKNVPIATPNAGNPFTPQPTFNPAQPVPIQT
jgi:hypothetical protein